MADLLKWLMEKVVQDVENRLQEIQATLRLLNDWHNEMNDWKVTVSKDVTVLKVKMSMVIERLDWVKWLTVLVVGGLLANFIVSILR